MLNFTLWCVASVLAATALVIASNHWWYAVALVGIALTITEQVGKREGREYV